MNNEDKMYKLASGTDTAIWAYKEIIELREQLRQTQKQLASEVSINKTLNSLIISGKEKSLQKATEEFKAKLAKVTAQRDDLKSSLAKRDLEQQALAVEGFCLPFTLRGGYGDIVWEQGKKVAQELRKQANEMGK
jgi:transcriptional regulator with XRE-family HTH domain